ncbi:transcription elongation factor GreB [Nannocystis sp. SCPEA4]|uniref:transcription elongation factor GreB n=1 Tax=Nannocystis sp. SCPEA4 TaxID=2996787 RepID=UPI00226DE680|nr:transcription elongation factor GreB [Nannocystis sp. SCPEA4]MCY1056933.1 transcription elongation factor GreB [Nannocystis sp. SCPEA4]
MANDAPEGERPKAPHYITADGMKKLRDELDHLWRVERPRVTSEVSAAAALGDRSENAEYIYGKRRLREIDRRLEFLAKRIESLTVFHPPARAPEKVTFGTWVTLEDEDGNTVRYQLVGPDEFDVEAGKISVASPVARALLGKEVDDEATVQRPRGSVTFTITAISYQPPRS